jgi:hypothetical protein
MARPEGFELPTLCLEAAELEILSALSSVAYRREHSEICPLLGYIGLQSPTICFDAACQNGTKGGSHFTKG